MVTLEEDTEIYYEKLDDSHYIGIEYLSGERRFIFKTSLKIYHAIGVSNNLFNNHSGAYHSIQNLLRSIDKDLFGTYVFKSRKELLEWLAFNDKDLT